MLVAVMVGSYFVNGAMAELMGLLSFLVIMTHMPLINAKVPASATGFFSALFEAAKWDPVPFVDKIIEHNFGFIDSPPLNTNFESLGYEKTTVSDNLGSLFYLLLLAYLLLFIVVLVSSFKKCSRLNGYFDRKGYKWNFFLKTVLDNYLVIFISACIGAKNLEFGFNTPLVPLNLSNILTVWQFSLCGLMFIVVTILYLKAKHLRNQFDNED